MKTSRHWFQRGNAIVEFAICAPFLIFLTLGVVEVGRFAYYGILVANAARAGATYGAMNLSSAMDSAGMESAASLDGANNIGTITFPAPTPAASCKCWDGTKFTSSTCSTGSTGVACSGGETPLYYVTVNVRGTINSIFRYPLIPKSLTINSTSTMQVIKQL